MWDNAMGDTYINRNNHTGVTKKSDPVTGGQAREKHGDDRRQVGVGAG